MWLLIIRTCIVSNRWMFKLVNISISSKNIVYLMLGIFSVATGRHFYFAKPAKIIIPEYSLLIPSSVSLTFWICLVVLIAVFLLSKKYKKFLVLPAPSFLYILFIKRMLLSLKWDSSSFTKEVNLLLNGNSNCERMIIVAFRVLAWFYLIIILYSNLSISSLLLGFIVVSFDAIVSKSFYFAHVSTTLSEYSLFHFIFAQCLAFFCYFMALSLYKAFLDLISIVKEKVL